MLYAFSFFLFFWLYKNVALTTLVIEKICFFLGITPFLTLTKKSVVCTASWHLEHTL